MNRLNPNAPVSSGIFEYKVMMAGFTPDKVLKRDEATLTATNDEKAKRLARAQINMWAIKTGVLEISAILTHGTRKVTEGIFAMKPRNEKDIDNTATNVLT